MKKMKTALDEPNMTEVFFGQTVMEQASSTTSKLTEFSFLEPDLDMKMVENLGAALVDSLGDASMDSFTDLSSMLYEPSFMQQPEEREKETDLPSFLNLDEEMKSQQYSLGFPHTEVEDQSSDLAKLSAKVGLKRSRTPSLDHDYSNKRARLSPMPSPVSVESAEEPFLVPEFSPASSPSPSVSSSTVSEDNRQKQRREKNNLASKRSREIRKKKFQNMEVEAERLSKENVELERRVAQLEKLAKEMKDALVTKLKIKT